MTFAAEATARAPANIAFIKYWGDRDPELRIPLNGSLSMNLSAATTTTTVRFDPALDADSIFIDGAERPGPMAERVSQHLDRVRALAGVETKAVVTSENSFPMGTGIASSASGFAALTVAAAAAAGLSLDLAAQSRLARRASGSASRSIPSGFVEWYAGTDDTSSYASSIAPPDYWDLRDIVAIVDRSPKPYSSHAGHTAGRASHLMPCRLSDVGKKLAEVRSALLSRDIERLGDLVEIEALSLHAVAMTGDPSILYLGAGTMELLHAVRRWRAEGIACYFTLDAGPNVHVICEGRDAEEIVRRTVSLGAVLEVIANRVAPGAELLRSP